MYFSIWNLTILLVLMQYINSSYTNDVENSEYSNSVSMRPEETLYEEQTPIDQNNFDKTKLLNEFIKYMINDMLFPIDGIVKGYCLYRSMINEMKYTYNLVNKESVVVATILLSGSWKNPIKFISHCKDSLKKVSNAINTSNIENSVSDWSNISIKRKSFKISRINICFKARICSRSMKKRNGIEEIRRFLSRKTEYGLIYPNEASEIAVWNTVLEFKDILAAGILKGSIYNHFRVLILFNYINKILIEINETPISLLESIALINAMVREESLIEWLSSARSKSKNQDHRGFDVITNLRYNYNISTKKNIYNFQVKTCIHVIWSSGIMFSQREYLIDNTSPGALILRKKITWICNKLFIVQ